MTVRRVSMPSANENLQRLPIYTSTSMLRVFTPGDYVETDDAVPFSELRVGDIIVFPSHERQGQRIIHRIIRKSGDRFITMGDNNPAPDAAPVTAAQNPSLATAKILPDGRRVALNRGAAGMRQFRLNRARYWTSRTSRKIGRILEPLMFWRVTLTNAKRFGDNVFFYAFGRPVARKTNNGIRFSNPLWKLLFKVK